MSLLSMSVEQWRLVIKNVAGSIQSNRQLVSIMTIQSSVQTKVADDSNELAIDRRKKTAAFLVITFGALLIWGTAYANPLMLHNAAHDSRHAFGFPCH